jgi:hypothetical protein
MAQMSPYEGNVERRILSSRAAPAASVVQTARRRGRRHRRRLLPAPAPSPRPEIRVLPFDECVEGMCRWSSSPVPSPLRLISKQHSPCQQDLFHFGSIPSLHKKDSILFSYVIIIILPVVSFISIDNFSLLMRRVYHLFLKYSVQIGRKTCSIAPAVQPEQSILPFAKDRKSAHTLEVCIHSCTDEVEREFTFSFAKFVYLLSSFA